MVDIGAIVILYVLGAHTTKTVLESIAKIDMIVLNKIRDDRYENATNIVISLLWPFVAAFVYFPYTNFLNKTGK